MESVPVVVDGVERKLGWHRQLPDFRDFKLTLTKEDELAPRLPFVDLTPNMPPIYDQDGIGCCTGEAICGSVEFEMIKKNMKFYPSILFVYANERIMEGTPLTDDSGGYIRDGIKSVNKYGVCSGKTWPFSQWRMTIKPSKIAYTEALLHQALKYQAVRQNQNDFEVLLSKSWPIVIGIAVYDSFLSDEVSRTGVVPMPDPQRESLQGGHAVLVVGYDGPNRLFIVRNSWGIEWGKRGYFTIPYEYVLNRDLADDFWVIQLME
jgi:C1A family cysteine protease